MGDYTLEEHFKELNVDIVYIDTLEPSYNGQEPKINPTTKETVTSNGQDVYLSTELLVAGTPDSRLPYDLDASEEAVAGEFDAEVEGEINS